MDRIRETLGPAGWLLRPCVDLRQHEIGLLCGMSRQRANVALRTLQYCRLIRVEPRGVTVLDLDGLRNFAGVPN